MTLCTQRRWRRRGERRRAPAVLLRLHHALPHRLLEGYVRLRPAHGVLERLGLLHRLHIAHRRPDRGHRRPGVTLRLHDRTEGLGDSCGVRGARNIGARWVGGGFNKSVEDWRPKARSGMWCILFTNVQMWQKNKQTNKAIIDDALISIAASLSKLAGNKNWIVKRRLHRRSVSRISSPPGGDALSRGSNSIPFLIPLVSRSIPPTTSLDL